MRRSGGSTELRSGWYRTQPLRRVEREDGERLSLWTARDALVLEALTWALEGVLPVSPRCVHVRGHGGAKAAVRQVLEHLPGNGFVFRRTSSKHPDKTFVGRVERGFEFLGYRFSPQGLGIAAPTRARFAERAARLYEQERGKPGGFRGLREYVRRWRRWVGAGLPVGVSVGSVFVGRFGLSLFVLGGPGVAALDGEVH